jgi:hypothetical protein
MECLETRIDGETLYHGLIVNVRRDKAKLNNGKVVGRKWSSIPAE